MLVCPDTTAVATRSSAKGPNETLASAAMRTPVVGNPLLAACQVVQGADGPQAQVLRKTWDASPNAPPRVVK